MTIQWHSRLQKFKFSYDNASFFFSFLDAKCSTHAKTFNCFWTELAFLKTNVHTQKIVLQGARRNSAHDKDKTPINDDNRYRIKECIFFR